MNTESILCEVAYALRQLELTRINAHRNYSAAVESTQRAIDTLERVEAALKEQEQSADELRAAVRNQEAVIVDAAKLGRYKVDVFSRGSQGGTCHSGWYKAWSQEHASQQCAKALGLTGLFKIGSGRYSYSHGEIVVSA